MPEVNEDDLQNMESGRVVLDNSGNAMQKQEDGSWMYADSPVGDPTGLGPFTPLTPGVTHWSFPPEVEKILAEWEASPGEEAESGLFVLEIRSAMAEARLRGTYAAIRTDYEVVVEAIKEVAQLVEEADLESASQAQGLAFAVEKLRQIADDMECRHGDC